VIIQFFDRANNKRKLFHLQPIELEAIEGEGDKIIIKWIGEYNEPCAKLS
jgi:hypothetical protein